MFHHLSISANKYEARVKGASRIKLLLFIVNIVQSVTLFIGFVWIVDVVFFLSKMGANHEVESLALTAGTHDMLPHVSPMNRTSEIHAFMASCIEKHGMDKGISEGKQYKRHRSF